jgi:hypothetical protein
MKKLTPFAVVYKSEVYFCIDEDETHFYITNAVYKLVVNKNNALKTSWDCSKFCEANGIKWVGDNESSSDNKGD